MTENKPVERETDLVLVRLTNGKEKRITRALATNAGLKPIKLPDEKPSTTAAVTKEASQ